MICCKIPSAEKVLHLWFRQQEARDLTITGEVLTGQAKVCRLQEAMNVSAEFQYSNGWLEGFKKRHGIRSYAKHVDAADASAKGLRLAQENVRKVLLDGGFTKEETHNQDESRFFWRQLPTRSVPITPNGAEQADQMIARLGGAQAQLQGGLDGLSTVARNSALLAQGNVMLNAAECMSLDGETEVIAEMSDAEIVRFVTTDGTNEGEEDDFHRPAITRQQVAEQAKDVHDYMLRVPVSVGRVRRDTCRRPGSDARSRPALGCGCLGLSLAPCVGLGFLVRLRFASRSPAMWRVCAIALSFVSGWRAFPSVSLCKHICYAIRPPLFALGPPSASRTLLGSPLPSDPGPGRMSCSCSRAGLWWVTFSSSTRRLHPLSWGSLPGTPPSGACIGRCQPPCPSCQCRPSPLGALGSRP
jgi:hypothetical protein